MHAIISVRESVPPTDAGCANKDVRDQTAGGIMT